VAHHGPGTKYHSSVVSAARRTRGTRLIVASQVVTAILTVLVIAACGGSPAQHTTSAPTKRPTATGPGPSQSPSASPSPSAAPLGSPGTYQVGAQQLTFTEPAHTGPTGQSLGPRTLVTQVEYPLAPSSGSQPLAGPLPLIVFGPGYQQCVDAYGELLRTWASAGYVVAAVTFPVTNCELGNAASESDLANQPADMSDVISSMLGLSGQQHDLFSGLLSGQEIGVAGQSDGGDTVAALAANTCCIDRRLKAAAVLSGAEWPAMPGQYFPAGTPPMLFTQGNADTINPPSASVLMYRTDQAGTRYYLNLFGASHLVPYEETNPVERLTARVTLAFFNRYVLGQAGALATMVQDGNAPGLATLVSGGHVPADPG